MTTETKTAYEAATELLRPYSMHGYVVLNSLQGINQDDAFRIFRVVQPFNYPLSHILDELDVYAEARIASQGPIRTQLDDGTPYEIAPLLSDAERAVARNLAREMSAGAHRAYSFATEILNETEMSMSNRITGGKGKAGPDGLDHYLSDQLGRQLPEVLGKQDPNADLAAKIDFLVEREIIRDKDAEIANLRAELEAAKTGTGAETPAAPPTVGVIQCGYLKTDGTSCKMAVTYAGERCRYHEDR